MSVRSGRVVKTVRTLTRPALEAPCSYSSYNCSLTRLEGFEYCSRHILEDKGAPFRQCNYIFTSTGKRCFRAAPTNDRKESRYCPEHSRKSLVIKQRSARKMCPRETPERLLTQLSHHQMDVHTAGQNAIPDPASVPGMASVALEYASDTDSDSEMGALPNDTLARREADSELDSADSDADPLEHAQVFTTEEITRIYLEKLQKLKSLYVGEYKRLAHILREGRRKYVQAVRTEKESMCSIHSQPKPTPEERMAYEQLKAMARYQKHIGTHSLLYRQQMERRLQVTEGVNYKPGHSVGCVKCVYSEGSWRCGEKSVPLSKYCSKHILHDPNQVLFVACGVSKGGGDECRTPVVCTPNSSTCVYHTPIPDPLPVSLPPLDDLDGNHTDMLDEELLVGGHLPTGGPQEIIDLSESHSFIVTEVPPENVMEGDGEDIEEVQGKDSKL
ncbi:KAT8 regulatory NSL complex subunit 2-like [Macrobrachium nipponense]|uniref:KAT8 regulatory NSL complex subunit 2-like n=1 Tax=Macrobrachium nipponense TaxID=159736 RepID=UPI0030C85E83